jgi:hypothetical protein
MLDLFPDAETHDPGGRRMFRLPPDTKGMGIFDGPLHCYRYRLVRMWGTGRTVFWLMMNPSTADPLFDDPTVAAISNFSRRWRFSGLTVGNTFAYRCTDQKRLLEVADPVGPANDEHILAMAADADLVMVAYGTPHARGLHARGTAVANMLITAGHELWALEVTDAGRPKHPLYISRQTKPVRFYPEVLAA